MTCLKPKLRDNKVLHLVNANICLDFEAYGTYRLAAIEKWLQRRMPRILWTNDEILTKARAKGELINTIKVCKITYLCDYLTGNKYYLYLIIQDKIEISPDRHRF